MRPAHCPSCGCLGPHQVVPDEPGMPMDRRRCPECEYVFANHFAPSGDTLEAEVSDDG